MKRAPECIILALTAFLASGSTNAASPEAWAEFRRDVEKACVSAVSDRTENPRAIVDDFGSESYGLALVRGSSRDDGSHVTRICVYDKRSKAVEYSGPMRVSAADSTDDPNGVAFVCDDDTMLSVRFADDAAIVTTTDGQKLRLPQQPVASGMWYSSGDRELRGKGDEITWTIDGKAPVKCTAVRGP